MAILFVLHHGAYKWAIKKLEEKPESAQIIKPRFVSEDEWNCSRGILAYNERNYDKALQIFGQIRDLSGPSYVRWKFYEAMCFFRKEQYQKIVMLNEPDTKIIESAILRLRTIVQKYPDDVLFSDAKYWYGQCLRFLKNDDETAFNIFQELLNEYPNDSNFKWTEGCMYYSAVILLKRGDCESRQKAILVLRELLEKCKNNSIQLVESGRVTYRVNWVVKKLARQEGIIELSGGKE